MPYHARMEKLLVDRREAAIVLSISLRTLDQLIANKKLQVQKIGKRVLIVAESLREYASNAQ